MKVTIKGSNAGQDEEIEAIAVAVVSLDSNQYMAYWRIAPNLQSSHQLASMTVIRTAMNNHVDRS